MKELHNTDWSGLHSCMALVTGQCVGWSAVGGGSGPAFLSPGWLVGTGAGPWPGLEMERETHTGQARPGRGGMGGVTPVLLGGTRCRGMG